MRIACLLVLFISVSFLMTAAAVSAQTAGILFTVNNTADSSDANPGDRICADSNSQCTLRAAIGEANANTAGRDMIMFALPWPAIIDLTLGPLNITANNFSIVGPGARRLTIQRSAADGTPNFRIIHIPNSETNPIIRGLTIRNGLAGTFLSGGGIRIAAGSTLNLTDVAILNNAGGTGGGIANEGTMYITRSLIASNMAGAQGGGVINSAGAVARISNSTITGSSAATGGAIYNSGSLLLVNNTITHNSAATMASGIFSDPKGSVNVLNTIIGSDSSLPVTTLSGTFISLGNNIVTDARGSTGFVNGVNNDQVSDNNAIDPLLGALADNGGQTDTRALLDGSPAINAGNSCVRTADCSLPPGPPLQLRWDQRTKYERQSGIAVDIGAYESGSTATGGSFSFGIFGLSDGRWYRGSVAVLTNVATGEKKYSVLNASGIIRFSDLDVGEVYVLEVRAKRHVSFSPRIIAVAGFWFLSEPGKQ